MRQNLFKIFIFMFQGNSKFLNVLLKIVINRLYEISFLTMHQTHDTILPSQCHHRRIQEHHLPRIYFYRNYILSNRQKFCIRNTLRLNPYLEIRNGLQSVRCPFIHVTNSAKRIIFQSIISVFDMWILRPTRWDRLWCQVQIMTNQILSRFYSLLS